MQLEAIYSAFKQKAEAVSAQVYRVNNPAHGCEVIGEILTKLKAQKIVLSHSELTREAQLEEGLAKRGFEVHSTNLRVESPKADVGICQLDLAVAETGSLVMDATNIDARLVSTLPTVHVALVRSEGLLGSLEQALASFLQQGIPGQINFITGPSRTSDIERVLTIGVHGPEKLIIVFVDREELA